MMKSPRLMAPLILIIGLMVIFTATGCGKMTQFFNDDGTPTELTQGLDNAAKAVATATAPMTGGGSLLAYSLLATAIGAIGTANGEVKAHKRKKLLREVDKATNSPPLVEQVSEPSTRHVLKLLE